MAALEGTVGEGRGGIADGVPSKARLARTGGVVIVQAHGAYAEAALRGRLFSACTAVSGVAPGTALGTTSAWYLHNPLASGVSLSLLRASVGYLSGTLGAGSMYFTTHVGVGVANPSGTAISIRGGNVGAQAPGAGLAFTTATVITQVPIRPLMNAGAALASTALGLSPCQDLVDGSILIPPGYGVGIHGVMAGGSTPLVLIGGEWEELPVIP